MDLFADFDAALTLLNPETPPTPPIDFDDPFGLFSGPTPLKYIDGVPVFSSVDMEIWGPPQHWGFERFMVQEMAETTSPFVTDFKMERELVGVGRPIHRYSRKERFIVTATNLLGNRSVPQKVMSLMTLIETGRSDVWEQVRVVLKRHGFRKYYNSIPFVLRQLGVKGVPKIDSLKFTAIVNDFMRLSDMFDRSETRMGRKYFPNIRFVTLKLFEAHGVVFGFEIPKVRTVRKKDSLEDMWSIIY